MITASVLKELKVVFFYMITFIFNVITLIFCMLAEQESKKMWSKFANVIPVLKIPLEG